MTRRLTALAVALTASLAFATSAQAGDYIVVLKDGASEPAVASDHAKKGAKVFHHYKHALKGYAATLTDTQLAAVRADSRVRFVAPDEQLRAAGLNCLDPGVPHPSVAQCLPWNIDRIDGDLSSTLSGNGAGSVNVNVAVLDTGISSAQPDVNVVGGKNCSNAKSYDDQNGHGTSVAGVIAARDNGFGVVGIAPGAPVWSVRVLNKHGFGNGSDIICGIDWVTSTRTDADPGNDIRGANMSLSGTSKKPADDGNCGLTNKDPIHAAICASVRAGVTYSVAAGNSAIDLQFHHPSAYDEVLTATSMTDFDGEPGAAGSPQGQCATTLFGDEGPDDGASSGLSNFATIAGDQAHTVAAPGVCVVSLHTCPPVSESCYGLGTGTSASAPHAAGTIALCIHSGACAGLTPKQIIAKIVADARAYNLANPGYGFVGDPLRPISGKYYGWLIRAGLY